MESFKFENLEIWKLANEYADEIHKIVKKFPADEKYALISQLNRSSSSVADNIAEGFGSATVKDYSNFLQISVKSIYETISQLYRAQVRGYITQRQKDQLYDSAKVLVSKIIAFKKAVNKKGSF